VTIVVHARFDEMVAAKHSRRQHRRLVATNQNLHRMLDVHLVAHAANRAFGHDVTVV